MNPLRIGVASLINTLPLIRGLEKGIAGDYELVYSNPSALADRLRFGELDAALIPTVEFFRGVGDGIVPRLCISSQGPVESMRFLVNEPIDQVNNVMVDQSSRTTVAMLRLLFNKSYRRNPDFHTFRPNPQQPLVGPDGQDFEAALITGDWVMEFEDNAAKLVIDLGEWWQNTYHRPFVYALWVYRNRTPGEDLGEELTSLLHESYRSGLREIPLICEEIALAREWSENFVHDYLTRRIQYKLDENALAGLQLFHQLCTDNFLAPLREETRSALKSVVTEPLRLSNLTP